MARYTGGTRGGSDVAPREGEERIDAIFNGCVFATSRVAQVTRSAVAMSPSRDSGGEKPHRKTGAMIYAQTCGCLWAPKHVTILGGSDAAP